MAVGIEITRHVLPVAGVKLGVAQAGIKKPGRNDVTLIEIAESAQVAAVFTKNRFCAAPVVVAKKHLEKKIPRYLLINTGNANAGTGADGLERAESTCEALAELGHCSIQQILPFSTGVIGETLPHEKIVRALPDALENLSEDAWLSAASAIMTTDTVPKAFSRSVEIAGEKLVISGISKGSGMIKPDMATMLSFVATNAQVSADVLQSMLLKAVNASFNSITVDSDTSTNDACVLIATGQSAIHIEDETSDAAVAFYQVLEEVMIFLAQAIIRDGEGATKFITVEVDQGTSSDECRQVAYTIAHSPLVKTAFFASDPNWGRILAAVGRAEISDLQVEKVKIFLDDVCIVDGGERAASYTEAKGQAVMNKEDICIRVVLGRGNASARIWTSDLSYDYVKINAEYRT